MKAKNSFDEVRLLLAFIVLFAHTRELSDVKELAGLLGVFDSDFAVKGFFAISGYLVTKSYYSSKNTAQYFEKRIRRIVPAYLAVIGYCLLVGMVCSSWTIGEFLLSRQTLAYVTANLAFLNFIEPNLPGVFENNSFQAMNGSLWTIKIELMLYCTVPLIALGYAHFGKMVTFIALFFLSVTWYSIFRHGVDDPLSGMIARQFPGQMMFFALGSVLGFVTFTNPLRVGALAVGGAYLIFKQQLPAEWAEYFNMLVYPVFMIALAQLSVLNVGVGRIGDLSYGVYLFHFPTIQLMTHFGVYEANPYFGLILGTLMTMVLALMCWHLVEKRFLRRSSHYLRATI